MARVYQGLFLLGWFMGLWSTQVTFGATPKRNQRMRPLPSETCLEALHRSPGSTVQLSELVQRLLTQLNENNSVRPIPVHFDSSLMMGFYRPSWLSLFPSIDQFRVLFRTKGDGLLIPLLLIYAEGPLHSQHIYRLYDPAADLVSQLKEHRWLEHQRSTQSPQFQIEPLIQTVRFQRLRLPLLPTVFNPTESSFAHHLTRIARRYIEGRENILILGSGNGADAVWSAQHASPTSRITATDINPLAVLNTQVSLESQGYGPRSVSKVSDGFENVAGRYDLILFNAPFPRDPDDRDAVTLTHHDPGGTLLRKVLGEVDQHLTDHGVMIWMSTPEIDKFQSAHSSARLSIRIETDFRDEYGGLYSIYSLRRKPHP